MMSVMVAHRMELATLHLNVRIREEMLMDHVLKALEFAVFSLLVVGIHHLLITPTLSKQQPPPSPTANPHVNT